MKGHDEKRQKRKQLLMSIFIAAIMTLSVLGYMIGRDSEEQLKYNGFKFVKRGNKFSARINGEEAGFDYFPSQVEDIDIEGGAIERIKNSVQLDATSDVNSSYKEAIAQAQFGLANILALNNQFVRAGFTEYNKFGKPVITCDNATDIVPVLMFAKSNQTAVYEDNNCIIINAKSEQDFIAVKDRILYSVLGVIQDG